MQEPQKIKMRSVILPDWYTADQRIAVERMKENDRKAHTTFKYLKKAFDQSRDRFWKSLHYVGITEQTEN